MEFFCSTVFLSSVGAASDSTPQASRRSPPFYLTVQYIERDAIRLDALSLTAMRLARDTKEIFENRTGCPWTIIVGAWIRLW